MTLGKKGLPEPGISRQFGNHVAVNERIVVKKKPAAAAAAAPPAKPPKPNK